MSAEYVKKVNDKPLAASEVAPTSPLKTTIDGKENASNKVTAWSSTTTDTHYPSEKLVKTSLDAKANTALGNVVSSAINNLYSATDGRSGHSNIAVGYGLIATIDTTNLGGYSDIHAVFEIYDLAANSNYNGKRVVMVNIRNGSATAGAGSYIYKINQLIYEPVSTGISIKAFRTNYDDVRLYSVGMGSGVYGGVVCKLVSCTGYAGHATYDKVTLNRSNASSSVPSGTEISIATETNPSGNSLVRDYRTIPQDISKGANLVVNGSGILGTNYNFSSATFLADTDLPTGVAGCFHRVANNTWCDEVIAINTDKTYLIEAWYRVKTASTSTVRLSTMCLDIDKNPIEAVHICYGVGTLTTLSQDLNPGDTVVHLTDLSGANWLSNTTYHRGFIFWNYRNSYGYLYPPETYSRNYYPSSDSNPLWDVENVNVSAGTITLNNPWSGPKILAGTPVSRRSSGATYYYAAYSSSAGATTTWSKLSGQVKGFVTPGEAGGGAFRPGTAFIRVGWVNANTNNPEWIDFTGIELRENPSAFNGVLRVANGGTGLTSVTSNSFLVGNGSSAMVEKTPAEVLSLIGAQGAMTEMTTQEVTDFLTELGDL